MSRCPPYAKLVNRLIAARQASRRPLTLTEKILFAHLDKPADVSHGVVRGQTMLRLRPDRVAMQDASAQMALLQFMSCGLPSTAIPASIHCDHMIVGDRGADVDLPESLEGNKEVYDFLESAAKKYGIEFWPPGAGIIHQAVLENYAAPGLMMLGTDSHTPNAGGLGAIAIGVGGADAVDALVDAPWELKAPCVRRIHLHGALSGWTSPKDVILHLAGRLTVRGGTGYVLEYSGPGMAHLGCTGMATICNMGAEVGATTSVFPFVESAHVPYLKATHRADVAAEASAVASTLLTADGDAVYDDEVDINLSELEPHINGPFTPDLSTPLSKFKDAVAANNWPTTFTAGLIGSCTNSSYSDLSRCESLVSEARSAGLSPKTEFFITPGSEQVRATVDRDGILDSFTQSGGVVLANACGPCIGQWKRSDHPSPSAILTSYNRNFPGRNDGDRQTMNFLASPEIVTAMAFSGDMSFNPVTDSIPTPQGSFKFSPPREASLPSTGLASGRADLRPAPATPDPSTTVTLSPTSTRLAPLDPFPPYPAGEELALSILIRVRGQCTTDTISAAGPWLKYKGHLPNISENTLTSALSADTGAVNSVTDLDGTTYSVPALAKKWRGENREWAIVAEDNYGEGSAREHAALQPRYLGGRVVLAKSLARIHEANLARQGIVPLTFVKDTVELGYDDLKGGDELHTVNLWEVLNGDGEVVKLEVWRNGRKAGTLQAKCALSPVQKGFVRSGSALNLLAGR
ncbi:aconitate hydratase [Piedraia hortae CBS 480.64]|uniref:Aconitate hydratase, mitochondrial n=1 Tax=Piedraia hortae CBS 480.64 TaxID=1314780 RepID=A0A6A7CBK5_9PEZI|nr:aconitate hydratase [Piedraia hortae CBS 480.64]